MFLSTSNTDMLQIDLSQPRSKTDDYYLRNTLEPVTCKYQSLNLALMRGEALIHEICDFISTSKLLPLFYEIIIASSNNIL